MESIIRGLENVKNDFGRDTIGYRWLTEAIEYIKTQQDKLTRRNMQIKNLKTRIQSLENALQHYAPQSVLL